MKKKKNILLLSSGLLVLVLASFFGYRYQQSVQRENVTNKYLQVLTSKKYAQLPEYLSKKSLKESGYNKQELVGKYEAIFNGISAENVRSKTLVFKKIEGNRYLFKYQLSFATSLGNLDKVTYTSFVVKEDGAYKIEWKPALIFPEMTGKDRISIQIDEAKRGEIVDRHDIGLAINKEVAEVGIVPKELGAGSEKSQAIQKISEALSISEETIQQKLAQSWVKDDLFVPLKIMVDEKTPEIQGLTSAKTVIRYYPLKESGAQLIGYTGAITQEDLEKHPTYNAHSIIGKTGLESTYDKELRGQDGGAFVITDDEGNAKKTLIKKDKVDGAQVKLTIDASLQGDSYRALNDLRGATVIMNPKDGSLLALASSPSFDPNKMAQGISEKDYQQYANDERKPFLSRFSLGYAPGSTFKTITAAIGLDAGITKPDKIRELSGFKWQKDASWGNYQVTRVSDVSQVNMRSALIYSDNIYFAQEALEMGKDTFTRGLDKFIFGEKLDLPIPMEPAQVSNDGKISSEIQLADTAYGQGELLINPIQQAAMYSVFSNGGTLIYPKLLAVDQTKSKENVISQNAAEEVKEDLKQVVANPNGTANNLSSISSSLAAKTGTAEIKEKQDEKGQENSFVMVFDPAKDTFLVVTLVEDYQKGQSATQLDAPLIKNLEQYLQ